MKTWLLERIGVVCLSLSAWLTALAQALYELAVRLVVKARPIPPAPLMPRIEWPPYVPRIDDLDPERTLTATVFDLGPSSTRATLYHGSDGNVHVDQWSRQTGRA